MASEDHSKKKRHKQSGISRISYRGWVPSWNIVRKEINYLHLCRTYVPREKRKEFKWWRDPIIDNKVCRVVHLTMQLRQSHRWMYVLLKTTQGGDGSDRGNELTRDDATAVWMKFWQSTPNSEDLQQGRGLNGRPRSIFMRRHNGHLLRTSGRNADMNRSTPDVSDNKLQMFTKYCGWSSKANTKQQTIALTHIEIFQLPQQQQAVLGPDWRSTPGTKPHSDLTQELFPASYSRHGTMFKFRNGNEIVVECFRRLYNV